MEDPTAPGKSSSPMTYRRIVLMLFLILLTGLTTALHVQAQTTSLSNLQYSNQAVLQNGVAQATVNFAVGYSGLPSGDSLVFGIADASTSNYTTGSATSTPDPCASLSGTKYGNSAACVLENLPSSGSESGTFLLSFTSPREYNLIAFVDMVDKSHNTISGSVSKQDFTISVTPQSTSTVQAVTTSSSGVSTTTMLVFGVFGCIILVGAVALSLSIRSLKKKKTQPTVASTTHSQSAQPKPAVVLQARPQQTPQAQRVQLETQPTPIGVLSTGYGELDRLLLGGLPEGYGVLLLSPPCDERDLLIRKIIGSALSASTPTFYVSSDPGRIQDLVGRYWKDFYALSPQADRILSPPANLFKIPGVENLSDLNISLTKHIEMHSAEGKTHRLIIIDFLTDILLYHKALTTRKWLSDFLARRRAEGFTILANLNPLVASKEETEALIDVFDGVIEIYEKELRERTRRFLVVKKMYSRKYSESELMLDRDKLY